MTLLIIILVKSIQKELEANMKDSIFADLLESKPPGLTKTFLPHDPDHGPLRSEGCLWVFYYTVYWRNCYNSLTYALSFYLCDQNSIETGDRLGSS